MREVRSFGKMKKENMEKMIANIYADLEEGDTIKFAFQGGEPTMIGLAYFENFVTYVKKQEKKVTVEYIIQTNGTLINDRWCKFLKENDFLVGLSIDSNEKFHDRNRVDYKQRGTYRRVMQTKKNFDTYEIPYNVLCVLTEQIAKKPYESFRFLLDQKIDYVQFIPCMDDFDTIKRGLYGVQPQTFAKFYKKIFRLWKTEYEAGHYISIKLFDDISNLFNYNFVGACGLTGKCQIQYVIEADGSVYPCDFYVTDEFKMGNIFERTLREIFNESSIPKRFICLRKELPKKCAQCPFLAACGGGCKRMENHMYVDADNDFCGYQEVLKDTVPYFTKKG
ncbi:anaerobic sulfatase maturase [Enterococcus termitis]|nr:anaerobic sulfatase maturase [Enterococcus termitis]